MKKPTAKYAARGCNYVSFANRAKLTFNYTSAILIPRILADPGLPGRGHAYSYSYSQRHCHAHSNSNRNTDSDGYSNGNRYTNSNGYTNYHPDADSHARRRLPQLRQHRENDIVATADDRAPAFVLRDQDFMQRLAGADLVGLCWFNLYCVAKVYDGVHTITGDAKP